MIKLAILGTISSHAEAFCQYASQSDKVTLVGIFGEDEKRTKYLCQAYGAEFKTPEELLEICDVAAILFRRGDKHLEYATPFIQRRIPVFIDKPFTKTAEDAQKLLTLCREYDCPVTGGSCVKLAPEISVLRDKINAEQSVMSGYCTFPIQFRSTSEGFHFYSHHMIETVLYLFGLGVKSIVTKRTNDLLTAIAVYPDRQVVMNFAVQNDHYVAGYFGETGSDVKYFHIDSASKAQFEELIAFAENKKSNYSPAFFMEAVKISNAIEHSMEHNAEVFLQ